MFRFGVLEASKVEPYQKLSGSSSKVTNCVAGLGSNVNVYTPFINYVRALQHSSSVVVCPQHPFVRTPTLVIRHSGLSADLHLLQVCAGYSEDARSRESCKSRVAPSSASGILGYPETLQHISGLEPIVRNTD